MNKWEKEKARLEDVLASQNDDLKTAEDALASAEGALFRARCEVIDAIDALADHVRTRRP